MPRTLRVPAALTALALGGWVFSAVAMHGMNAMDGPGPTASFLWLWIAMSAGMMLPSLVPAASLAVRVGRSTAVATAIFVEKATSVGARASLPVAVALAGAALWIAP